MAQQVLNNAVPFSEQRTKINANFTELYATAGSTVTTAGAETLSNKTLTVTESITLDTTPANTTSAVGKMVWNDTDGTLDLGLKGGNVTLQIGQEQILRVTNKSGTTLTDGEVVYILGSLGDRLTVDRADANSEALSSHTIGIVTETILNNQEGFITVNGLVRGLNTSAFAEGDVLYLSGTPGGMTTTRPTAPDNAVFLGFVVRSHVSLGSIYVNVINGVELYELHDVNITGISNNQILRYVTANSRWENSSNLDGITLGSTTPAPAKVTTLETTGTTSFGYKAGYAVGAGGVITQSTSKSTVVTLSKPSGQITVNSAALAGNTTATFQLINTTIEANDTVSINRKSGGTAGAYLVWVDSIAAGSCIVAIRNITAGSLSESPILQFNVTKGSIS